MELIAGIFTALMAVFMVFVVVIILVRHRGRKRAVYTASALTGTPLGPGQPGLKHLYPGVYTPPDPYNDTETSIVYDPERASTLPKGVVGPEQRAASQSPDDE